MFVSAGVFSLTSKEIEVMSNSGASFTSSTITATSTLAVCPGCPVAVTTSEYSVLSDSWSSEVSCPTRIWPVAATIVNEAPSAPERLYVNWPSPPVATIGAPTDPPVGVFSFTRRSMALPSSNATATEVWASAGRRPVARPVPTINAAVVTVITAGINLAGVDNR